MGKHLKTNERILAFLSDIILDLEKETKLTDYGKGMLDTAKNIKSFMGSSEETYQKYLKEVVKSES